jgi:ArsR family transcriptional regulator, lead/cadmium/zinc/bismuth-responsive transcriptional repressor
MDNANHPSDRDLCQVRTVHMERVKTALANALPEITINRLASMFKILGDPTRLRIVTALQDGEMCVCDLAAFLNLTESAASHQLRRLKDLALVKNRREGQVLFYSLDDDHVSDLLEIGLEHAME